MSHECLDPPRSRIRRSRRHSSGIDRVVAATRPIIPVASRNTSSSSEGRRRSSRSRSSTNKTPAAAEAAAVVVIVAVVLAVSRQLISRSKHQHIRPHTHKHTRNRKKMRKSRLEQQAGWTQPTTKAYCLWLSWQTRCGRTVQPTIKYTHTHTHRKTPHLKGKQEYETRVRNIKHTNKQKKHMN